MKTRCFLFFFLLIRAQLGIGQTPVAPSIGRFSGITAGGLNPAFLAVNPLNWDFNVIGTNVLFTNSAISLDATSISALQKGVNIDLFNESSLLKQVTADRFLRETLNGDNQYFFGQGSASGLGFMFSLGPRWTFGISNQAHSVISSVDLSAVSLRHAFEGINYSRYLDTTLLIANLNLNGAFWTETNFQASWMFIRNREWMVSAGVGVKWLNALGGFSASIKDLRYLVPKEDTLIVENLDMRYAISTPGPINNSNLVKSSSLGFDLGISIAFIDKEREKTKSIKKVKSGRTDCYSFRQVFTRYKRKEMRPDYQWKAGIALLDIGSLSINEGIRGKDVTGASFGYKNGEKIFSDDINYLDTIVLKKFAERGVLKEVSSLDLFLNSRLSIQLDYRFGNWGGIGFSMLHRLDNSGNSIKRMNHLALVPRLEWSFLELAIPLNLFEYQEVGIGGMVRLGPLTVGTDRLGELLGMKRIYGADLYFSLRVFDMF